MSLLPGSPWKQYEMLQRLSDKNTCCDARDYAIDAALDHILDNLADGQAEPVGDVALQRVQSSAARRHRHRARLARIYLPTTEPAAPCAAVESTTLSQLQQKTVPAVFQLVWDAASGATDGDMATARGIRPGALRVRLSRARRTVLAIGNRVLEPSQLGPGRSLPNHKQASAFMATANLA